MHVMGADRLRLAEPLAGLSLVCDAGMGRPPDEQMRTCLLATSFARHLGLAEARVANVYYTALLRHLGCTAYAPEAANLFGNDVANNDAGERTHFADPKDVFATYLPTILKQVDVIEKARIVGISLSGYGMRFSRQLSRANCEVGRDASARLGLPTEVQQGLYQSMEWFNGKGGPERRKGDEIDLTVRVMHVGAQASVFSAVGGPEFAVEAVKQRAGGYLDPDLVQKFLPIGRELIAEIDSADTLAAVLDAEPQPQQVVTRQRLDEVVQTFGDLVDLKSHYMRGHSSRVADLAEAAATRCGLDPVTTRLAASTHDLGRVAVSAAVWDKKGPLTSTEWEAVRLHAYHSERILERSPVLKPLAGIAGMHHERHDGSGYHRGSKSSEISPQARVLAAADVFAAMTQPRAHRPALTEAQAADEVKRDVRASRLDGDAAAAVLQAAGAIPTRKKRSFPAGLTERQVEVLRLVSQGRSNKEIARALQISTRTAEHHVQDIYTKIGVSSRASAALFTMEKGLL